MSRLFSAVYAPISFVYSAVGIVLWSAITVAQSVPRYGMWFGIALLLTPNCDELLISPTNIQWFLVPVLAVIILTPDPVDFKVRINQLLLVILAGITGPFSVFLLPFACARLALSQQDTTNLFATDRAPLHLTALS